MSTFRTIARTGFVGAIAAGLAVPLSFGSAALADPKGETFTLTCGGTTYTVATPQGNGEFTPAMDIGSHLVFVPHAFQGFHGELYDPSGALVDQFSDDTVDTQGSGKQKNDVVCTYTFSGISDGSDPEGPPAGYRFVGTGGVTGQIAGHA